MRKTKKSVSKRIRLTRTGKSIRRPMGIDHAKTKKTNNSLRHKRKTLSLKSMDAKVLRKYAPHA